MALMGRNTGKIVTVVEHLRQSIIDILITPLGTRVMRREYGSGLFRAIDSPINETYVANLYAIIAIALDRWEPRFQLTVIGISVEPGQCEVTLTGIYIPLGTEITLDNIRVR